jgi:micrococcal nuclease
MDLNFFIYVILGMTVLAFLLGAAFNRQFQTAKVIQVLDGDTIVVSTTQYRRGVKVRLCGIDCPEESYYEKQTRREERFAREVTRFMEDKLPPKTTVFLEYDKQKWDQHGRLLAYVYIGKTGKSINAELVRNGMAYARPHKNNHKHDKLLRELEAQAQRKKLGIWEFQNPI